jgi:hypothetical protein
MTERKRKVPDDEEPMNSYGNSSNATEDAVFPATSEPQMHQGVLSKMTPESRDNHFRALYDKVPDFALLGQTDKDFGHV